MSTPQEERKTWQSFEEISAKMTDAEKKSEIRKQNIGFFLGPILFILLLLIPLPEPLAFKANIVLATLAWTITWWICEPIPIPATARCFQQLYLFLQGR
jgi:sodium-dependent dicarboxylate transporter 2/3/5